LQQAPKLIVLDKKRGEEQAHACFPPHEIQSKSNGEPSSLIGLSPLISRTKQVDHVTQRNDRDADQDCDADRQPKEAADEDSDDPDELTDVENPQWLSSLVHRLLHQSCPFGKLVRIAAPATRARPYALRDEKDADKNEDDGDDNLRHRSRVTVEGRQTVEDTEQRE
jgi:hypothetical protein